MKRLYQDLEEILENKEDIRLKTRKSKVQINQTVLILNENSSDTKTKLYS